MTRKRPITARLYLLFTPTLCRADPWATLEAALEGGVELVQWRDKPPGASQGLNRCLGLCNDHGVPVIVNDDPACAIAVGAAGAHVGQDDMPPATARTLLGPERWLGTSTHDPAQVIAAVAEGAADHLGYGPCFATTTKGYPVGTALPHLSRAMVAAGSLPVFAIGGIDAHNVQEVLARGARRIAVSAAILRAPDPRDAARALRDRLG